MMIIDFTLKPCPFCGEAPGVEDWGDDGGSIIMVGCVNEDCFMLDAPLTSVAGWNERTNGSES